MKKFISILAIILCVSFANAQDCNNENVTRFMARGKTAIKVAEKPEDYKLAANEFKKALEYAPKCADIYYQLGLCYEQMGKLDPGNYQEAISYLNNYLALKPTAQNKEEIQEKIYEIEFFAEKAGGMSLKSLVGKWKFYKSSGIVDTLYNVTIFENEGKFFAKHLCVIRNFKQDDFQFRNNNEYCNSPISYKDGIITFTITKEIERRSFYGGNGRSDNINEWVSEWYMYEKSTYSLKFNDRKLVGEKNCTSYEKSQYEGKAINFNVNDDKNTVTDCTGDCGNTNVYFVKQ